MIMRLTFLLFSMAALSACAPMGQHDCKNPRQIPINVKYGDSELRVVPHRAQADPGDALRFKLDGDLGIKVTVAGKDDKAAWITGDGSNKFFFVCVPENQARDVDYEYKVTVQDVGTLDPVVRIYK